ncbi:MAG: hypothetical protein K2M22_07230, partial [Lachnospiraceae bacterium]|nr:hypothetical protein [Lachnospiraceae bacterium]
MRRPLCLLGLAFVAALLLASLLNPRNRKTCDEFDKEGMVILGVVEGKDHKLLQDRKVSVISLGQVIVLKSDQVKNLMRILNYSEKNQPQSVGGHTAKQIRNDCEKNRKSL